MRRAPEKALPGICAEKDGKIARSSTSPRGRPMSADIFCCSFPACTLARFDRCLSPSDSLWDKRGCSREHCHHASPQISLERDWQAECGPRSMLQDRNLLETHAAAIMPAGHAWWQHHYSSSSVIRRRLQLRRSIQLP